MESLPNSIQMVGTPPNSACANLHVRGAGLREAIMLGSAASFDGRDGRIPLASHMALRLGKL